MATANQESSPVKRRHPGQVRDAVLEYLRKHGESDINAIYEGVSKLLGQDVAKSSVRSYLNINADTLFIRTGRGRYRLRRK